MDVTLVVRPTKLRIGPDPASFKCVEKEQTSADVA